MRTLKMLVVRVTLVTMALQGLLAFWAPIPAQAAIANGVPAIDELGHVSVNTNGVLTPNFTAQNSAGIVPGGIVPNISDVDTVHHRLFIADQSGAVLVFILNSDNTLGSKTPVAKIGRSSFWSTTSGTTQSLTSDYVDSISYDSVHDRLFVGDDNNVRVLVFDFSLNGMATGMNASYVLGQPDFTSNASALTQSGMGDPEDVKYDSTNQRLFVDDHTNNRVLIYDLSGGITNGMNAAHVLFQPDFTSDGTDTTQSRGDRPGPMAYDSALNRLFVTDLNNSRVLVFSLNNGLTNGMNASYVLGQDNFISAVIAEYPATQTGMAYPWGLVYDQADSRLFVADIENNRILMFDLSATTTSSMPATRELGHPAGGSAFTDSDAGTTQSTLRNAYGMGYDPTNKILYVGDYGNNREMLFDVNSITNGEPAVDEIGRYSGSTWPINTSTVDWTAGGSLNRSSFAPYGQFIDTTHHRLFVATTVSRVLEFDLNSDDTLVDRFADHVLGQTDFYSSAYAGTTQSTFGTNTNFAYDAVHDRLFMDDDNGHRILVFDVSSITDGENAQYVIGQPNFTSESAAATQTGMNTANGMVYDPALQRLFVADAYVHRVVIYDLSHGISNGMNAAYVIGQTNFTSTAQVATQTGMALAGGLALDSSNHRLFVSDSGDLPPGSG